MMDRKLKAQVIEMLENVKQGIAHIEASQEAAMLEECIAALQSIADICREQFSAERYAVYGEVFDGMLSAAAGGGAEQLSGGELQKAAGLCTELIDFTIQELQHEKEIKKEIVFLPYKASMWDSLESIWQAAADDKEHCNAYVVPIPYADRNPDMTAKEWHCEIELFPDYVPVIDYREFDLAKLHPDVIFIHNPYDNCNAATSVTEEYYSSVIKKYTEMLVYVPYFVTGDTIDEHFCQVPGVVNADKVIVENEKIKAQYEKYYPGGNPSKDKFLALGSPKYDKVMVGKEAFTLPETWQRKIRGRKIILYNTSIQATIAHYTSVIDKMRHVFAVFKTRKDVVLWWRPHPLLKTVLDSMVPEIAAAYRQLEQEYIEADWGIYDDSPDLHRAIVCSDAYYGDPSSVIQLYKITKKPIVIQNLDGQLMERNAIDFLLNLKLLERGRDTYALPEPWQQRMRGKKAVLCNLRLESFMEAPEQFIAKLQYIVQVFAENKDIVLWWRPHIRLEQAVKETIPEEYAGYQEICRQCQAMDNCIYDTTNALERAIVWTDAYYGDMDEAVWQYATRQRPILLSDGRVHTASDSMMALPVFLRDLQNNNLTETYAESQRAGQKYGACYLWGRIPSQEEPSAALLQARQEEHPLPEKWAACVKGKKVVLFHTTANSVRNGLTPFTAWMKHVSMVYKNMPDITIWWHADASLIAAIQKMEEDKQKEYQKLVQEYEEQTAGIYDDSNDSFRMLAWTDAYYGDFDALMWAYRAQHKPVMLQNMRAVNDGMDVFEFLQFFNTITMKKEEIPLPEKWRKIIEGKKVVLYYMGWANAAGHLDKVNAKLRYVLATFKEQQNVALWWKVDPMIERGLQLVVPEMAEEYRKIAREYAEAGWGIYDNLRDVRIAVLCADAYYGDDVFYGKKCHQGVWKKFMEQNFEITSRNDLMPEILSTDNIESDGKKVWFVPIQPEVLFEIDLSTGKLTPLGAIPDAIDVFNGYRTVRKVGNQLFIIPAKARDIMVYDLAKNVFSKICIPDDAFLPSESYSDLYGSAMYANYLFLFGVHPVLIRYDLSKRVFRIYRNFGKLLKSQGVKQIEGWNWRSVCANKDHLLFPVIDTNCILDFDITKEQFNIYAVGEKRYHYSNIQWDGHSYWLTQSKGGSIVNWEKNKITEYNKYPDGLRGGDYPFRCYEYYNGDLWMLPAKANMAIVCDLNNGKMERIGKMDAVSVSILKNLFKLNYTATVRVNNHFMIALHPDFGYILCIDFRHRRYQKIKINFSEKMLKQLARLLLGYMCDGLESSTNFLDCLLYKLESQSSSTDTLFNSNVSVCGIRIYNSLLYYPKISWEVD